MQWINAPPPQSPPRTPHVTPHVTDLLPGSGVVVWLRYAAVASFCHAGRFHLLLKPPEDRPATLSGLVAEPPDAPPTAVTYGDPDGHCGTKMSLFGPAHPLSPAAPESPLAKRRLMPRAAHCCGVGVRHF